MVLVCNGLYCLWMDLFLCRVLCDVFVVGSEIVKGRNFIMEGLVLCNLFIYIVVKRFVVLKNVFYMEYEKERIGIFSFYIIIFLWGLKD